MSTYLEADATLEQHIAAMRMKIIGQFAETSPGSLTVLDVCSIAPLVGGRKVTLFPD